MLKNISWGTLFGSKTFWAGLSAFGAGIVHAYGVWVAGNKGQAITEAVAAFSLLLGAIGLKDATSGPVN